MTTARARRTACASATGVFHADLAAGRAAAARRRGAAARRQAHRRVGPPARLRDAGRVVRHTPSSLFFRARPSRRADRELDLHLFTGSRSAGSTSTSALLLDPLSMTFVLLITGVGSLIHIYSVGYMDARPRPAPVLRLPQPVRRGDAAAGARRQLPAALRRLGGRRPGVVPADRLLVSYKPSAAAAARRRSSSNRVGDVGLSLGDHADVRRRSAPSPSPASSRGARTRRATRHDHRDRPAAAARRVRQVRRSSRCRPGCPTRWRARPRSRR